jgi:GNAT superfamily N-acetyltransferase
MNLRYIPQQENEFDAAWGELKGTLYPDEMKQWRRKTGNDIDGDRAIYMLVAEQNGVKEAVAVLYRSDADDAVNTLLIGNYEADTDEAATALLAEAEAFARKHNFKHLLGPMNGSTWGTYRFRKGNLNDVFFSEHYHPPHYLKQWEKAGFTETQQYISTIDYTLLCDTPEILALEAKLPAAGLFVRALSENDFNANNLRKLYTFCITAFADNVLYASITSEVFLMRYAPIGKYLAPGSSAIIEDEKGEIHGLLLAYPDHFCTTEKRFIIKTVARHPQATFKGIGTLLGNLGTRYAKQHGYTSVIHAYMHSGNASVNLSGKFSGELLREYVLLEKML